MTTLRRTKNYFVYLIALFVTGICSFLGFKGPSWARSAVGAKHRTAASSPSVDASPSLARAVAAARPQAKVRGTGAKKTASRTGAKKIASRKTARERTAHVSSL